MSAYTYGMEFEIEGLSPASAAIALTRSGIACDRVTNDIHETSENWKAVYDGSVGNGSEVVSPILDTRRLNEGAKVLKALSTNGARVSTATGYHVHVGVAAFHAEGLNTSETLAQFVLNYYGVHHAIGALVAPSRLANRRYCRILGGDEALAEAEWLRDGNYGSRSGNRYTSLNLESMQRHGTIEVRIHQGTLNGVKAVAWAHLITALIEATKAGARYYESEALHPWAPLTSYGHGMASVEDCTALLNDLTASGHLSASTSDWLANRARHLNG